jgi:hypothetical protein
MTLQKLTLHHNFASLDLRDLNICLDYNNNKITVIAILGLFYLKIDHIPIDKISSILPQHSNSTIKHKNDLSCHFFFKLNDFKIESQLLTIETSSVELKINKGNESKEGLLKFNEVILRHLKSDLLHILYLNHCK